MVAVATAPIARNSGAAVARQPPGRAACDPQQARTGAPGGPPPQAGRQLRAARQTASTARVARVRPGPRSWPYTSGSAAPTPASSPSAGPAPGSRLVLRLHRSRIARHLHRQPAWSRQWRPRACRPARDDGARRDAGPTHDAGLHYLAIRTRCRWRLHRREPRLAPAPLGPAAACQSKIGPWCGCA